MNAWIEDYARKIIGVSEEEIRRNHPANFPPISSVASLDELLECESLAYVRRNDFSCQHDWASHLLNELFEHTFGMNSLFSGLQKHLESREHETSRRYADVLAAAEPVNVPAGVTLSKCQGIAQGIEYNLQELVVACLRSRFGDSNNSETWFFKGVPEAVKRSIATRRVTYESPEPYEFYFDILDYHEILSKHWKVFGEFFAADGKGVPSWKEALDWIKELNDWRNRFMHASRHPKLWRDDAESPDLPLNKLQDWLSITTQALERYKKATE